MIRTVCDVGDAHVRLQAPAGWVRVEQRGTRVVLRDESCPTPIFLEPLPGVDDIDRWIAALVTRKARLSGHQQSASPAARRFVLSTTTRESVVERAYQVQPVPSSRSDHVWVAASVDLDGDRQRTRLLSQAFPGVTRAPNVSNESGLRQFIEDGQRSIAGWPASPGFTLKLPRGHTVAEAAGGVRFLLREQESPFGWLTCGRIAADEAAVTASLEDLRQHRGAGVERLSEAARLAMMPEREGQKLAGGALWVTADEHGHLVFSLERTDERARMLDFFRRIHRGLRIWTADFRGYWTPPHSMSWADFRPAAPPAPAPAPVPTAPSPTPQQDLRAEWESRLGNAMLRHKAPPVSSGYDPRFHFFSGERVTTIYLHSHGGVRWEETGFLQSSVPGLPMGPGEYRKERRGTWRVVVTSASAQLVLDLEDGVERFELGRSGAEVTLDGRGYALVKI